jgi:hypothetical protein
MPKWKIVSGARPFYSFPERENVGIGWARDLVSGDVMRTVNVCVSKEADSAGELPDESKRAIRSHGRSVFNAVLDEDDPPRIVDVTITGLVFEYGGWEPEVEEEEADDLDEDDDELDFEDEEADEDEDEDEDDAADESSAADDA